jgi:RNA polymerase sigma factor (sigma-70 family)
MVPIEGLAVALVHLLIFVALVLCRALFVVAHEGPGDGAACHSSTLDSDPRLPRWKKPNPAEEKERAKQYIFFRPKTRGLVWRWLRRLGIPKHVRRDVRQDVFLAAHESFHSYDPEKARPERWLNKIAVHVAAHYNARARYRTAAVVEGVNLESIPDEHPLPDELIEREETRRMVQDALQTIDRGLGDVVIAYDIDGRLIPDIAAERGMAPSTVYKWRTRGHIALAEELKRRQEEEEKLPSQPPSAARTF